MKDLGKALSNIAYIGQLGLSLIMPLLLMMLLCWVLTSKAGLGDWVYIPGFILGIGSIRSRRRRARQKTERRVPRERPSTVITRKDAIS